MQDQDIEYAGFWVRVAATLVDTIIMVVLIAPLLIYFYGWEYFSVEQTGFIAGSADFLLSWILPAVAVIIFWMRKQATPGKMLFSLNIVDAATGKKPTAGQFAGRYLAYFISIIPLCIGLLWVAFDQKKQGWHDKLAGTVVVRTRH